ncbi:winged helix-turn-helix domain-containing protein [Jeotgalibacillus marinus]|uniref:Response regulator transcription factor n=1 Tax=Jeotgalibacillus marinus TaxID=86667 RepID=A0ABV3Q498_9BACL
MEILVIEDNPSVSSMLEMFFTKEGYDGEFIQDGKAGYERFSQKNWDLLIIDWMLPTMDGVTICKKIREESSVPIIMLTAKDTDSDQVLGLEMGADDYITKPFSPITLMARIKAIIRRTKHNENPPSISSIVKSERIQLSNTTREVWLDEQPITNLTPKEFDLLLHFVEHPRQVFSREQLLDKVWGYTFYGDERTVDVHIKRLRKKLDTRPSLFHTVWGVGYKFDETGGA